MSGAASTEPRRGQDACHSRIVAGRQAGERPDMRSPRVAWPRDTAEDVASVLLAGGWLGLHTTQAGTAARGRGSAVGRTDPAPRPESTGR
jgi:hypothetical protein